MKFADFLIPETLDEARDALKALGDKGYPLAGGTAFQYLSDRPGLTAVDITRLDLGGITRTEDGFRAGATTSITELARYHAPGWVLHRAASAIPYHPLRNISTLGGNIARLFPWSDLPVVLLVIDAVIEVQGDSERSYTAQEFFTGPPSRLLGPGDLVTAVELPAVRPPTGFAFKKETTTIAAFSLMTGGAALTLDGDRLTRVRLAANSALPRPARLTRVEELLEGQPADPALFGPAIEEGISGMLWRGREGISGEFAAHLARVILRDVLVEALANAGGVDATDDSSAINTPEAAAGPPAADIAAKGSK